MYTALFLAAILYWYIVREEKTKLYIFSIAAAIVTLCPLTALVPYKYFQGFYEADSLQWLLPVLAVVSFAVVDIYDRQTVKWKKYAFIPAICIVMLLSGHLSQPYITGGADEGHAEAEEIYDLILDRSGERQAILVAPKEIMEDARAYDGRLMTAYGKDIWETDLDYAFYGNYEEWAYGLAEHMNKSFDENDELIINWLAQSGATHVVFDKENLTFDENMYYPSVLQSGAYTLKRMEETGHYVIYSK